MGAGVYGVYYPTGKDCTCHSMSILGRRPHWAAGESLGWSAKLHRGEGASASWKCQKGFNFCSPGSVRLLPEKASGGCPARLLCYLWTAKLQGRVAALIQQNTANLLQCCDFFFPQGSALSYAFYAFFPIWFVSHMSLCRGVSAALVKPEQDQPAEAEEECKTPGNKNSLFYILHVN